MEYYKRAIFPQGQQRIFLEDIQRRLNWSPKELSGIVDVSARSIRDWRREKYSMSFPALEKICRIAEVFLPENIEIKDPFWYTSKGARIGGLASYRKYGFVGCNPEYRRKRWYEWWEQEGRYKKHPIINTSAPFNQPPHSLELAELIGIILGDGGLSKCQLSITLNKFDDKDFISYVKTLLEKLFGVAPSVYKFQRGKKASIVNIVISRVKLIRFLVGMGLCIGSKTRNQVDVPLWVKQSPEFARACLRGLFDTDGCFYIDTHFYKNKIYKNCGMNFTNRSLPILSFFKSRLEKFGLHPTQKTQFSVFLRKEQEIVCYFQIIGSSNFKHLNKFFQYFKGRYGEVPKIGYNGAVSKTDGP